MSKITHEKEKDGYLFRVYSERPSFDLYEVDQVHGAIVLKDQSLTNAKNEADGILSKELKKPLAIKTADCLPIFVLGKSGVALLHAGWRGVHQKISVSKELLEIEPYYFYIGPFIQALHFEVGEDFRENFPHSEYFIKNDSGRLCFDLGKETFDQIKSSYPNVEVEVCSISTFAQEEFHSYRENGTAQRNWNILSKID